MGIMANLIPNLEMQTNVQKAILTSFYLVKLY